MRDEREYRVLGDRPNPKPYMTAEEYRVWHEKLMREVGPYLERNRAARALSEENARHHLVD